MSKRFTDTELWQKEWFQNLSLKHKILLKYIFENCDCAGIWEFNFRMASFIIGENVTIDDIKEINQIKKQFEILDNKLYICDFIKFQYGKLSYACKPHLPVIKLLEKNGIEFEILDENDLTIKQMRKRLTETAKKQIFIRDKFECQYCGSKEDLEIDHIIPLSQGGNNEDSNLITACHRCNSLKGDKKLKDFLENNREIKFLDRVSKILDTLEEKEKEKEQYKEKEIEKINPDFYFSDSKQKVFDIYKQTCTNLIALSFEPRNKRVLDKVNAYLNEINNDFEQYKLLCEKANKLEKIAETRIDFEMMLNCYIGIMNGKYETEKPMNALERKNQAIKDFFAEKRRQKELKNG